MRGEARAETRLLIVTMKLIAKKESKNEERPELARYQAVSV